MTGTNITKLSFFLLTLTLLFSFQCSQVSAQEHRSPTETGEYIRKAFLDHLKKPFNSGQKKKILIIGDSHAQDFFNGVMENNFLSNYQLSTRYIPTRCQIYLSSDMMRYTNESDRNLCEQSDNLLKAKAQMKQADIVILIASWRKWSAMALPRTIENLRLSPNQKLLIIGGKSFGKITPEKYKQLPKAEWHKIRNEVSADQPEIYNILSENLSPKIFVNLHQLVCGSSNTCPIFTDDLKLITMDGGHLTKSGAKYIGKILFQDSQLRNL